VVSRLAQRCRSLQKATPPSAKLAGKREMRIEEMLLRVIARRAERQRRAKTEKRRVKYA
jgi:hypothetical protein